MPPGGLGALIAAYEIFAGHERNFVLSQLCMRCILAHTNPPAHNVRTSFDYGVGKGSAHRSAAVGVQWVAGLCGMGRNAPFLVFSVA